MYGWRRHVPVYVGDVKSSMNGFVAFVAQDGDLVEHFVEDGTEYDGIEETVAKECAPVCEVVHGALREALVDTVREWIVCEIIDHPLMYVCHPGLHGNCTGAVDGFLDADEHVGFGIRLGVLEGVTDGRRGRIPVLLSNGES